MKTRLLKYLFSLITLAGALTSVSKVVAQSPTFDALTTGVSPNPITPSQTGIVLLGFKVTVTGGSMTFNKYTFACNQTSDSYVANGTLYRSTTNGGNFNNGAGTPVGNVVFNGGTVTIDNLTESITNTTYYYFLVADNVFNSTNGYCQFKFVYANTFATDESGVDYPCHFSSSPGYNYNANPSTPAPYAIKILNASKGLNNPSTILTAASTNIAMFGFSLATSTGTKNINQIQINSNLGTVSDYFSSIRVYTTSTTDTYSGSATQVAGTVTTSGGYIKFVPTTPIAASTSAQYYWLVANVSVTGSLPVSPQFNFITGQSNVAFTAAPSGNYNDFTAFGGIYNINSATVTLSSTSNLASGTLTALQSDIPLFGFGIAASSNITVSGFNINSTNTADVFFGSGKLYTCPTSTYSTGSRTLVPGALVNFNGNYANITGLSLGITSTAQYYFLVADNISAAASSTITFKFQSAQTSSAVIQSGPSASAYNTFNLAGNTLTLPNPTVFLAGANNITTNGISPGGIYLGQTGIILFGFSAQAFGASFHITKFNLGTTANEQNYFGTNTGSLYRSTSAFFPGGTPLYTNIALPGGSSGLPITVNETIPAGTTYYYWFTADYTKAGPTPATFKFSFTSGQSQPAVITSSGNFNTFTFSGNPFTFVTSENFIGGGFGQFVYRFP